MDLSHIIGNKEIISFLKNSIYSDRLSHSYIFEGISGIGKMLVAENFAKRILCELGRDEVCNVCSSCIKFDSLNHPDFKVILPDGKSIKNKQIEEFQEFALTKPYYSSYKVVIIDQAETMTISAQNRILKTIEDAPEHLIVIFISMASNSLLPTIQSRCQNISFNRIEKKAIIKYLVEKHGITEENAAIFASFSDGSMKRALDVGISEDFSNFRKFAFNLIENLQKGNKAKLFSLIDDIKEFKDYTVKDLLDLILVFYRDILFIIEFDLKDNIINKDYIQELQGISRLINRKNLIKYIEKIEDTKKMIDENVNEILALESFFINTWEV